jgi:uncharacterized protein (DUF1330 family)
MKIRYVIALAVVAGFGAGAAAVQVLHAQAKPPAYVVVEIDVTNNDAFLKEYAPIAGNAIGAGGGKYLARGGENVAIDGEPPKPRTVVIASAWNRRKRPSRRPPTATAARSATSTPSSASGPRKAWRSSLEHFQAKWTPVRRRKCDQA